MIALKFRILLSILTLAAFHCIASPEPKQVVIDFVVATKQMNFVKAESLISADTKGVFLNAKKEYQGSADFKKEMAKNKTAVEQEIINKYKLNSLVQEINGSNAIVKTPDNLTEVLLEKRGDSWQIICKYVFMRHLFYENDYSDAIEKATAKVNAAYNKLIKTMTAISANWDKNSKEQIEKSIAEIEALKRQDNIYSRFDAQEKLSFLFEKCKSQNKISEVSQAEMEEGDNNVHVALSDYNAAIFTRSSGGLTTSTKLKPLKSAYNESKQVHEVKF